MPVRTFKPSYGAQASWFMSRKAGREVYCESSLERDFYILLEFFDWVVTFEEQPLTLPYLDADERLHEYTPDTQAHLHFNGVEELWLYEVKLRADLKANWQDYRWKFRGAVRHCRDNGFDRFKIVTEKEIRGGHKLKNIKRVLKKRYVPVDSGLVDYALGLLAGCVSMETRTFLNSLRDQGIEQNDANVALSHLIANHRIGLELDEPFTYDTDLWLLPK